MLQLLLNVAGMAAAGWLTLAIQESVWSRMSARRARLVGRLRQNRRQEGAHGWTGATCAGTRIADAAEGADLTLAHGAIPSELHGS